MISKIRYNMLHKRINMKIGDKTFITLYKGYNLSGGSRKINKLYRGPFEVVERVGILIYYLKLPPTWKIYNIISIAMFKPGLKGKDSYNWDNKNLQPLLITNNWRDFNILSWEIKILVNHHFHIYNCGKLWEKFYIKWINYRPKYNT